MSDVFPLIDGWAGFGDLGEKLLTTGQAWDSEDPRVRARPDLFTEPPVAEPVKRGPGRPPGARSKPKAPEGEVTDG